MPFIEVCINSSIVAYKTISNNYNLYLYTNKYSKKKLFWNIVNDFLKNLASIQLVTNLKKASLR
jgi:hypothetical protein